VYEVDETRDLHDPNVAETDRMRNRIAELEQVVRELRQKNPPKPQAVSSDSDGEKVDKKRRVIVDRYARFKIDEAAMAAVQAQAEDTSENPYKDELYSVNQLPGEEIVYDQTGRKTFLGAPAGKSMLRRVSLVVRGVADGTASRVDEYEAKQRRDSTTGRGAAIGARGTGVHWVVSRHAQDVSVYDDMEPRELQRRDHWTLAKCRAV
jgi:hypothetical protein